MSRIMCKSAKEYLDTMGRLCQIIDYSVIDAFAKLLFTAWQENRQVLVFGNGGSACTSGHFVIELLMTAGCNGPRGLRAIALSDNIGTLTAVSNDWSYEKIFSYPLRSYGQPGDIAVAISGSGNSPNVLQAVELAKAKGMKVVALTGFDGGKLKDLADLQIHIPNDNYGIIEDLHLSVGHIVGQILNHAIAADSKTT